MTTVPAVLDGKPLVVVDVEGNGQQPPEIIEIAILPIGEPVRRDHMLSWLVRPKREITGLVTRKVHGISNADVQFCPLWTDIAGDVQAALTDRILVAHNATVEHRVLSAHLPGWAPSLVLDTLRLAKHVWPDLNRYGLEALAAQAGLDLEGEHHRAGYDTWCAWELLRVLLNNSDLDWTGLVRVAALPEFLPAVEPEGGLW
jgi:DNA polymerase III epsilon subunit-like protein